MNIDDFDDWNRAAILSAALEYSSDAKRYYDELIHTETKLARVTAERDRLREALEFYAYNEWADGYPGGVFVDDEHTILDFGETAMEALQEDSE